MSSDTTEAIPEPVAQQGQEVAVPDDEPILDISQSSSDQQRATEDSDAPPLDLGPIDGDGPTATVSLEEPPLPESELQSSPSRSQSRSRRHRSRSHRHRSRQRLPRWTNHFQFKKKESNFPAAVCSMIVVVLLCTAMVEPQWFTLEHGGCREMGQGEGRDTAVHYLGLNSFFYRGKFLSVPTESPDLFVYKYGPAEHEVLINCVTPEAVQVIKSLIALCFIGILLSTMGFLLDLNGPNVRVLRAIQRHAVFSMCTVAVCVTISGFGYWVTEILLELQRETKPHPGSKLVVQFSVSVYLVAAAGGMAVIAAACNLLRRHGAALSDMDQRQRLIEAEIDSMGMSDPYGPLGFVSPPPPPPYEP